MSARAPQIGDTFLHDGEMLTLDGNEGVFHAGAARLEIDYPEPLLARPNALRQLGLGHCITGAADRLPRAAVRAG